MTPNQSDTDLNYPQFPLYIVSKGRSEYMVTSKALTAMGVEHNIIVEPQEVDKYRKAVQDMGLLANIIELDMSFKEKYELCDNFGLTKSTGPGPARNFAWEHSIQQGFSHHWVMDDNIRNFRRLNKNDKVKVTTGSIFRAMEDFCARYKNVGMAGPNYVMFAPARQKRPPFIKNTRIYSCNFIRNDLKYRWRGRYNEDTILSIDMLKGGWCTIQFNAFLQEKMVTQLLKGGNTDEFYHKEGKVLKGKNYADTGTVNKSRMQVAVHPDVSEMTFRYGRWHHHVNYRKFSNLQLIKKDDQELSTVIRSDDLEYGMQLKIKE